MLPGYSEERLRSGHGSLIADTRHRAPRWGSNTAGAPFLIRNSPEEPSWPGHSSVPSPLFCRLTYCVQSGAPLGTRGCLPPLHPRHGLSPGQRLPGELFAALADGLFFLPHFLLLAFSSLPV